jgi:hypothetical protein
MPMHACRHEWRIDVSCWIRARQVHTLSQVAFSYGVPLHQPYILLPTRYKTLLANNTRSPNRVTFSSPTHHQDCVVMLTNRLIKRSHQAAGTRLTNFEVGLKLLTTCAYLSPPPENWKITAMTSVTVREVTSLNPSHRSQKFCYAWPWSNGGLEASWMQGRGLREEQPDEQDPWAWHL